MASFKEEFENSNYGKELFSKKEVTEILKNCFEIDVRGKSVKHIKCLIRNKALKWTPEEEVRQLYVNRLLTKYKYPKDRIQLEYPVQFGADSSKGKLMVGKYISKL
jgi:type I restriction enzyme M protein